MGGSIGIPLMALLSIHCMHMLVKCTEVCKLRKGDLNMVMDYSQVIETACLTGTKETAKYAQFARYCWSIHSNYDTESFKVSRDKFSSIDIIQKDHQNIPFYQRSGFLLRFHSLCRKLFATGTFVSPQEKRNIECN